MPSKKINKIVTIAKDTDVDSITFKILGEEEYDIINLKTGDQVEIISYGGAGDDNYYCKRLSDDKEFTVLCIYSEQSKHDVEWVNQGGDEGYSIFIKEVL